VYRLRTVVYLTCVLLLSAAASAQQDVINTIAGGGPNNLPATSVSVYYPIGPATDPFGDFYFLTFWGWVFGVFRVSPSGTLTMVAGNGSSSAGSGTQGHGVAADSFGNVYIADTDECAILRVDKTGAVSVFAGQGPCGYGGDGGPATSAYLYYPVGVAVDSSGNVFIADTANYRIREVTVSNGEINTVAGNGNDCVIGGAACGDGGSASSAGISDVGSLAVDGSGNVYIADEDNNEIRKFSVGGNISTVAGNGNQGYSGDGEQATSATLDYPTGVAVDSPGNIFIADSYNYRIREVTVSNGVINTVAGNGSDCESGGVACGDGGLATKAGLSTVFGVAVDSSDDLFIADYDNLGIREVTASNGVIKTVAGNGIYGFAGNGVPATNAALDNPTAATTDPAGNVYVADDSNCIVRQVDATTGLITTFAGTPDSCGYGGDGGAATSALLNYPSKAVAYAGSIYVADPANCVIREVNSSGDISTFAGTPGSCAYGGDGGPATSASLNGPSALAVDSSGNMYIADTANNVIRVVSAGVINTVAGNGTEEFAGDGGAATSAELDSPGDVAVDAAGNLYIADTWNARIRMVNTHGIISTFAGGGGGEGDGGPANQAGLLMPSGVAVDAAGNVLIADSASGLIRWVDGLGVIHTVAGNSPYTGGFAGDGGPAFSAELAFPDGVSLDSLGDIYIADTGNNRVRKINAVAGLNASTASVTFGAQAVGTSSDPMTVTLSAVGPLDISNIAATGDFSSPGDCVTGSMSGQCVMSIVFKPTQSGTRTGTVTISDNGYFSSSLMINLSGTGATWQQVPGLLSQISVGSDGTVWGLNSAGQPYMFNPQTQTWQQAPGVLTQITVASSGVVWGLNAAGQIYRYDPSTKGWDQIPGTLSQLAVGSDGDVWGINSSSQIFHFNAATQTWVRIPGALTQIAVGYDGGIWGLNASQQVYRFNPGTQSWQQLSGLLKRVVVGGDGDAWGINSAGQAYHFNTLSQQWQNTSASLAQIAVGSASNVWGLDPGGGIWCYNGQAQAWNQVPGQLMQITVGEDGAVWGLNSGQQIYQFVQPTQATQTLHPFSGSLAQVAVALDGEAWGIDAAQHVWRFNAQQQSWQQIPGGLHQIAVGFGGNVWGLNAAGQVWQFNPATQGWGAIPGLLAQIAVGADGSVWGLSSGGQIWRFNSSTQTFQQIAGSLAQIAVGADGTVWGLNSAGQIFRFNSATQGWDSIPGGLSQIAVGSANNVWGLNAAGQVFRYDSQLQSWDSIPGILTSLAVAFDGTVWGLNSANQIWRFNAQTQSWDSIEGQMSQISVGADAVIWGVNANASGQTYTYW